jgi:hypothetical protein
MADALRIPVENAMVYVIVFYYLGLPPEAWLAAIRSTGRFDDAADDEIDDAADGLTRRLDREIKSLRDGKEA